MLTSHFVCVYNGSRGKNSKTSGFIAPVSLGDFFVSDSVGSAKNKTGESRIIPHILFCVLSSRYIHGLNGLLRKGNKKMTNQISIYNFNQNQVRTHQINNEPYFCLIDCCRALEIKQSTDRTFAKGVEKIHTLTKGGMQELTFINEPNLYRLIFRSNKPQAQAFADWVYSEVLPSIRKTGTYTVPAQDVEVSAHTRRLPSKPREIVLSEKARSEIGGIVKRCCAVAIKEALSELSANLSKDNPQYSIFDDRFESIDDRDLHNAITAYGNIMKQRGLFAGVMQTKDYILSGQYAKDQKKWEKSYNSRK